MWAQPSLCVENKYCTLFGSTYREVDTALCYSYYSMKYIVSPIEIRALYTLHTAIWKKDFVLYGGIDEGERTGKFTVSHTEPNQKFYEQRFVFGNTTISNMVIILIWSLSRVRRTTAGGLSTVGKKFPTGSWPSDTLEGSRGHDARVVTFRNVSYSKSDSRVVRRLIHTTFCALTIPNSDK